MTESIRRPVSQLRAGDLISLDDGGTVHVVCAISQPVGSSRRAELVDARTGEPAPWVRLDLYEAVLTVPGRAQWFIVTDHASGTTETILAGDQFEAPAQGSRTFEPWSVEVDSLGRPGWEQLRRGLRTVAAAAA